MEEDAHLFINLLEDIAERKKIEKRLNEIRLAETKPDEQEKAEVTTQPA